MTAREPWCDARHAIRSALGLGRATAIARAIENKPPAHMLAAEVAAAKEPFDAALTALDEAIDATAAAIALIDEPYPIDVFPDLQERDAVFAAMREVNKYATEQFYAETARQRGRVVREALAESANSQSVPRP